ncbi:hypothetical protein KCU65_g384, partial [Aureobasidium melanogenum]
MVLGRGVDFIDSIVHFSSFLFTRPFFTPTLTCYRLHSIPKSQGCPTSHYPSPVNNFPAPVAFEEASDGFTQLVSASHVKGVRAVTEPGVLTLIEVFEPQVAQVGVSAEQGLEQVAH